MEFQRLGDRYQLRLEIGDELMGSLTHFARAEGITYAALSGLGAVRRIVLGYYSPSISDYERHELTDQMELLSLIGNIAQRDGQPALHIHAALARQDLSVIGGHVFEAEARPTMEIWVRPEEAAVQRVYNDETHLALMQLPERLPDNR